MIQVKEFLNCQEHAINEWLRVNFGKIKIVDVKYSVGTFSESINYGMPPQAYSGCLIIYEV